MHRPVVMGQNGLVSCAHPLAAVAGLDVLKKGGNAFDAAIAVNAVLGVVHPHKCGIGGDVFFLLYAAQERKVFCLNGSGRSPLEAGIETLSAYGYESMPLRGVLSVTVPGCVHGWGELSRRFGSLPWESLLQPAIHYAREGFPLSHQTARGFVKIRDVINKDIHLRQCFTNKGRAAEPGDIIRQEALAATLQLIAGEGPEVFYKGAVAARIHEYMSGHSGLLSQRDMELHTSTWTEPLRISYGKYAIWQTPPNTQGLAALLALNIVEGLDLAATRPDSAEHIHYLVEAKKLAFEHRKQYITDPEFVPCDCEGILNKQYAQRLREMIRLGEAGQEGLSRDDERNTTGFVVADGSGNVLCGIQSLYSPFGAGCVAGDTGIILQNRGCGFSFDPSHINRLEPHKRTFHTLTAALVTENDKPVMALAASGADGQTQTHLQILTKLIHHSFNIQQAIEEPRWVHGPVYPGDKAGYLNMEGRFPVEAIAALEAWGHHVRLIDDWADETGQAQGLVIDRDKGVFFGGADPRLDGYALAW